MKDRVGTYAGIVIVALAVMLWTMGCGGGGGGGTGTSVSAAGGTGTTGSSGSGTTSTTTGGTTAGTTTGGISSSNPPPPPSLAIPLRATTAGSFVPNKVLVKTRSGVSARGLNMRDLPVAAASKGVKVKRGRHFCRLGVEEVEIESGQSVDEAVDILSQLPEVEYAEPDYILTKTLTPTDPRFDDLWAHQNTGQSGGTVGADIDSTLAWDIQTGDANIIISVIDTGVDYNHPDLAANMWRNPGEDGGTPGVDDDNNGYVDDIFGINAITGSGNPLDDEGHGTHVAGTAAAAGNNGVGVVGVAFTSKIMALKFLNSSGTGTTSDAIECLEYAVANGAHVSNASWGGPGFSSALFSAIQSAGNNNHLFVAAAGNDGLNLDARTLNQQYPAGYNLSNIISVGASTRNEEIASFSNFGPTSVDLFAPGLSILSTLPNNSYAFFSGTSMATPQVSGVAALLFSELGSGTSFATIKSRILDNVEVLPVYQQRSLTGGRLNAYYALDPGARPTPTTSPTATPTTPATPQPISDSISLAPGWNLFSFPVGSITSINVPTAAESVFWVWNPSSQSYTSISPTVSNLNSGSGTARGFWVFSDSSATISYQGVRAEAKTLVLEEGWNLVGLPRDTTLNTSQLTITNLANSSESIFADAVCDDIPASAPCLAFQYVFFWVGSYANLDASQGTTLGVKRAYWIHAWERSELDYFPISIGD